MLQNTEWIYQILLQPSQSLIEVNHEDIGSLDIYQVDDETYHILYKNKSFLIQLIDIDLKNRKVLLKYKGITHHIVIKDKLALLIEKMGLDHIEEENIKEIRAPMPGRIAEMQVENGSEVEKGEVLLVIEAMKMENSIKCPTDSKVKKCHVQVNEPVEKDQLLISFE